MSNYFNMLDAEPSIQSAVSAAIMNSGAKLPSGVQVCTISMPLRTRRIEFALVAFRGEREVAHVTGGVPMELCATDEKLIGALSNEAFRMAKELGRLLAPDHTKPAAQRVRHLKRTFRPNAFKKEEAGGRRRAG